MCMWPRPAQTGQMSRLFLMGMLGPRHTLFPYVVWQAELNLRTVETIQPTHSGEQIQETCREMELEPWRHHVFSVNPYPKYAYFWAFQLHESIVSLVFNPIWIGFSVACNWMYSTDKKGALAGVSQWLVCRPSHWRVGDSIPGQGFAPRPWLGWVQ